jgi:hypothetical protein
MTLSLLVFGYLPHWLAVLLWLAVVGGAALLWRAFRDEVDHEGAARHHRADPFDLPDDLARRLDNIERYLFNDREE